MKSTAFIFAAFLFSCTFTPKISINNRTQTKDQPPGDTLKFPKAEYYVNDFDDIFTTNEQNDLNTICADYDKQTTNQIVVATFKSFDPYAKMETFCTDLFNEWKVGTKEKSNGLMIIIFKDLHKVRIEAGRGTQQILTNSVCDEIMQTQIIPHFKKSEYYLGVKNAINKSIELWK